MFDISPIVLWVLGGAVLGAGVLWLIQWYNLWKGTWGDKQAFLELLVGSFCDVAEKMYVGEGRGKEKLAWVLGVLLVECEKRGITFDVAAVTEMVNAYVLEVLNAAKKETLEENLYS